MKKISECSIEELIEEYKKYIPSDVKKCKLIINEKKNRSKEDALKFDKEIMKEYTKIFTKEK